MDMENRLKYEDIKDYPNLKIYDQKVGLLSSKIRKLKNDLKKQIDMKQSKRVIDSLEDKIERKKEKLLKYIKDMSEVLQAANPDSIPFSPISKEDYEISE